MLINYKKYLHKKKTYEVIYHLNIIYLKLRDFNKFLTKSLVIIDTFNECIH